jgi:hypothetical protein
MRIRILSEQKEMSLTNDLRRAHAANPTWGYAALAEHLKTKTQTLRGLNSRLHLPIPIYGKVKPHVKPIVITPKQSKPIVNRIPIPNQLGSGRKQYGGYLKLL